ncbi:MAG: putative secreted protein [Myxococcales bacterium]|nr:putative secreted protein [Myxococcales bacterium]
MTRLSVLLLALSIAACASHATFVTGTSIPFSDSNKSVLDAVEEYRLAVERGDADALMLMAAKQYWEDSGTPSGSDDYGYEGLRNVLLTRLQRASDIRYSVRYMNVHQQCTELKPGCHAQVDVMIDASFTIADAFGKSKRPDKRDQNQLVLEWDGKRWLFLSGM